LDKTNRESKNNEGRVREDITPYMYTLIIDRKTLIIYGLNNFFILEKIDYFHITTWKFIFLIKYLKKKILFHFITSCQSPFVKRCYDKRSVTSSRLVTNTSLPCHRRWWRDNEVSVTRCDDMTLRVSCHRLTKSD